MEATVLTSVIGILVIYTIMYFGFKDAIPSDPKMGVWITKDSVDEILYVCKSNGKLIRIDGSKTEIRHKLAKLLKDELTEKKLSKIKTSNYKIIEPFKGLNSE